MSTFRHRLKIFSVVLALTVVPVAASVISQVPGASASVSPDTLRPAVSRAYCGNGTYAVSITPAKGFNPLTATTAQLDANGYPARPPAAKAHYLAQWRTFATRHSAEKSSCGILRNTDRRAESPPVTGSAASPNWSGYQAGDYPYGDIEAEWEIPPIAKSIGNPKAGKPPTASSYSSSWVGIGDGESNAYPLVQGGSESDSTIEHGIQYYLFFEVAPEETQQKIVTTVKANQLIAVHVTEGALSQPGCANVSCSYKATCTAVTCALIHISDMDSGFNESYEVGGQWTNDDHAEWIYERTCLGTSPTSCYLPYLADAAPTFFDAQATVDNTWYQLGSLGSGNNGDYANTTVTDLRMISCDAVSTLAYPNQVTGATFGMTWEGYGDNDKCGNS